MNIKKIFIFASVDMEKLPYFHGETGILSYGKTPIFYVCGII